MSDTIFAPITSISNNAVAVIRISGDKALECLRYLGIKKDLPNRQVVLTKILDPESNEILDHALVTYFKAPNSFTGQDVAEINLHGSIYVVDQILKLLGKINSVRMAQNGEFSKIAFLNGKMDLLQAEAIADLINSETKEQHRQALRQMNGDFSRIYEKWRYDLVSIMANLEAFIDFPDEDLPDDLIDKIEENVANIRFEIESNLDDNNIGQKIRSGLYLAIIGQPNVGKSSLINYLSKSDAAIVSDIAGTTRDVVEVHLQIGGFKVVIADTAGIRDSSDFVEKEGIKRSLKKANEADLKIIIFDVTDGKPNLETINLIDEDSIIVINKIDTVSNFIVPDYLAKFNPILISVKKSINLADLVFQLEDRIRKKSSISGDSLITNARYRESLINAVGFLSDFSLKKNVELASEDLRLAANEIGKISGKVAVDDILDVIFSKFCIGK